MLKKYFLLVLKDSYPKNEGILLEDNAMAQKKQLNELRAKNLIKLMNFHHTLQISMPLKEFKR